jgi:hypothetical protein
MGYHPLDREKSHQGGKWPLGLKIPTNPAGYVVSSPLSTTMGLPSAMHLLYYSKPRLILASSTYAVKNGIVHIC